MHTIYHAQQEHAMNQEERREARAAKIKTFNESGAAQGNSQIFGLPFSLEESEVALILVPWDVTLSYREGTANGPDAICAASKQVDLYDPLAEDAWMYGFATQLFDEEYIANLALQLRPLAQACIRHQETGRAPNDPKFLSNLEDVNKGGETLNGRIYRQSLHFLEQHKIVGVVGGDHSVPLGLMQALAAHYGSYGILHIDAHFDHRDAFEGFKFSHASIMRNASRIQEVEKIVHVGIRDYCKEEAQFVAASPSRFITLTDWQIAYNTLTGAGSWLDECNRIMQLLPQRVYVSFDIDGLDQKYCPNTGTPVPGGLEFSQACFLLCLLSNKKQIIGFDLCEVAPAPALTSLDWAGDWNAIVGSRMLYKLCSLAAMCSFGPYSSQR